MPLQHHFPHLAKGLAEQDLRWWWVDVDFFFFWSVHFFLRGGGKSQAGNKHSRHCKPRTTNDGEKKTQGQSDKLRERERLKGGGMRMTEVPPKHDE